jgi:hypothetical protein
MKTRITVVATVALCALALWARDGASPARASDGPQASGDAPKYEYVGNKKCKSCHLDLHKSWSKTPMGMAFETLKPGHAKEGKEKFHFDLNKDYTADATCLPCHTTGYGKPGGYAIPPEGDRRAARKAKSLEGVGCEDCHGPGSGYVEIFEEIDKTKRSYTDEELYAAGLRKIDKAVCVTCHNDKSPTFDPDAPFDFDKAMEEFRNVPKGQSPQIHERQTLKLRQE